MSCRLSCFSNIGTRHRTLYCRKAAGGVHSASERWSVFSLRPALRHVPVALRRRATGILRQAQDQP